MRNAKPGMNSRRALMPLSPYSAFGILPSLFDMSRLDQALVERGLCESREKAKRAVMAGLVTINRQPARKPSDQVRPHDQVELEAGEKYVSRGGHKLEHALKYFNLNVEGLTVVDLGASTGGFTHCLLLHRAGKNFPGGVRHRPPAREKCPPPPARLHCKNHTRAL